MLEEQARFARLLGGVAPKQRGELPSPVGDLHTGRARHRIGDIPVVVVGSGLSALGAIRLLRRAGITAYVFGTPQIEARSRFYRAAPGSAPDRVRPEHLAGYLAGAPMERAVLLPASDAAVTAIGNLPKVLAERFVASVSRPAVADQLTDKALFGEMLEDLGVPAPKTRRIDAIGDLERIPEDEFAGAFLKPVDSGRFMARFGVKGKRVSSRQDAIVKAMSALAEGHRLVLQEYIPTTQHADGSGRRADHVLIDGFIGADGVMKAMFARRRLRMFPLDFGNTSAMVSIPVAEVAEAARSLTRVATGLGCRGIVSAELKQDPRDGIYKLLEINSRVWWFVEYAGRCGVDLCTMSYLDALGLPIEPVKSYREGARFVHAYYDFHALKAMRRAGRISLGEAAASWIGAQEPLFNWSDPMPALVDLGQHIATRLNKSI